MTQATRLPDARVAEPCLSELLRQALSGLLAPTNGLTAYLDRMERTA